MKIKQVEVKYGRTISTGSYESARFDVGLIADVDEGEDANAVYLRLLDRVRSRVECEINDVLIGKGG